jgi:hypothetical protein
MLIATEFDRRQVQDQIVADRTSKGREAVAQIWSASASLWRAHNRGAKLEERGSVLEGPARESAKIWRFLEPPSPVPTARARPGPRRL